MRKLLIPLVAVAALLSCSHPRMEIKSRGVALQDGAVLHYLEAGQGPVLVLVHGLGSSSEVWRESMRYLSKSYRVIAPDLPGYGKSDRPRADYSVEYQAAMLKGFLDAMGLGKVALAGHSFGGWIAALACLSHPEMIDRLILVDSAGLRRDNAPLMNLNPTTIEEQRSLLLALFADKSIVNDRMVKDQWEYWRGIRATVKATLESLNTRRPLLDERLKSIKIPTLIIWGRQDRLTALDLAERFASGIKGSKLVVIDDAGHMPQVEKPKEFYRAVKRFVKSW